MRCSRTLSENLFETSPRRRHRFIRQCIEREEPVFGNLTVGGRETQTAPAFDGKQNDVISREGVEVRVNAKQARFLFESDARFLVEFPCDCGLQRFSAFNAATGKMPARAVAVAYEKNLALAVSHHCLCTECHAMPVVASCWY